MVPLHAAPGCLSTVDSGPRSSSGSPRTRRGDELRASGLPELLPMPRAVTGAYSPDGRRIAYEDISVAFARRVGPGAEQPVAALSRRPARIRSALMNLADYSVEKLPWTNSNDSTPMWVGDVVYFLSDRNATTNLFSYEPRTKQVAELTRHDDFDIMSASAGPGAIVYEQAGYIHLRRHGDAEGRAAHDRSRRRFPVGAAAVQEGRRHDSQRRAVADRRARGLRSARRHLHRAGRERHGAQPDAEHRRARSQPGVVARRHAASRGSPTRAASIN